MKKLAPVLFDKRFDDLLEIGHARLRALAPEWTDHNAHDPGITLMELLAWVTESQLYSLSRLRRDERTAFAALFGLAQAGTQSARGLIWPDRTDPGAPVKTCIYSTMLPTDAAITALGANHLTFRPSDALLWVPGAIRSLVTRRSDGSVVDHTLANERGNLAFLPFGERAGARDVLRIEVQVCGHGWAVRQKGNSPGTYGCASGAWGAGCAADGRPADGRGD